MPRANAIAVAVIVLLLGFGCWWMLRENARPPGMADISSSNQTNADASSEAAGMSARTGAGEHTASEERRDTAVIQATPVRVERAIIGVVLDAASKPVAEAEVSCTPGNTFDFSDSEVSLEAKAWMERAREQLKHRTKARTDKEGRFRLAVPTMATIMNVMVAAPGHLLLQKYIEQVHGGEHDVGVLTLKPGAIVSGRVVDPSGIPVAGALVSSARGNRDVQEHDNPFETDNQEPWVDDGTVRTDADGRFTLHHVEPGTVTLFAKYPDYPMVGLQGLKVEAGSIRTDALLKFELGAAIRGKILGYAGKWPQLRVSVHQASNAREPTPNRGGQDTNEHAERGTEPKPDGTFALRGLKAGRAYRVFLMEGGSWFGRTRCSAFVEVNSGADGVELLYEAGVTLMLRVLDKQTQQPLERLWIHHQLGTTEGFFMGGRATAKDYAEGKVALTALRPKKKQNLTLTVQALGYRRYERKGIELPLLGILDLGTVELEPIPVIRVQVRSATDGQPVVGATLRLLAGPGGPGSHDAHEQINPGPTVTKTDTNGRGSLNPLARAEMILSVHSPEFAPYLSTAFAAPSGQDDLREVQLYRGGSVAVQVMTSDGHPATKGKVAHVPPTAEAREVEIDAQGRVVLHRLSPGEHRFRATTRGMGSDVPMPPGMGLPQVPTTPDREEDWSKVSVTDGVESKLTLSLPPTATLSGIVRENGMPLADAMVRVVGQGASTHRSHSDKDGRYQLAELPLGEQRLQISHKSRAMAATVPVAVIAGANTFDVDLDLTILRGVVRDPEQKPVPGARVRIQQRRPTSGGLDFTFGGPHSAVGSPTADTDEQGRYELRGIASEVTFTVTATAKGFARGESKPVQTKRGEIPAEVDVQLELAGSIQVRVSSDTPNLHVVAKWLGNTGTRVPNTMVAVQSGVAKFENLRVGPWELTLRQTAEASPPTRRVEVQAGVTSEVSF